jgi:ankyrin repeat protein
LKAIIEISGQYTITKVEHIINLDGFPVDCPINSMDISALGLVCSISDKFLTDVEKSGLKSLIQMILKYGADVNRTDAVGRTPLHMAAASGNMSAIQTLFDIAPATLKLNTKT